MDDTRELISYSPTEQAIAAWREQFMRLKIRDLKDAEGYKAVHEARMVVKDARVSIEKKRKELKADALEYGRKVDAEAKRITALIEPIELHLQTEESRIDAEREAVKNAARLQEEAEARAKQEAEKAAFRAEQELVAAEARKLAAEREALEADKRKVAEQHAAQERAIAAEKAKLEAEQRRLVDAERERQRAAEVERARSETAERVKRETEARLKREAEEKAAAEKRRAEAAEAKRIRAEALRPDREKILTVAAAVRLIEVPELQLREKVLKVLVSAAAAIEGIASELE